MHADFLEEIVVTLRYSTNYAWIVLSIILANNWIKCALY